MRILFTTVALFGHFYPLVPLARTCRERGHEVLLATSGNFTPVVEQARLPIAQCGQVPSFVELMRDAVPAGLHERLYADGRAFGHLAQRMLPGMTQVVRRWRPDLVVSERAEFSGPIAAAECGLPSVEVQWGVASLWEYRAAAAAVLDDVLARLGLDEMPEPTRILNPWPPSLRMVHAADHQSMRHVPYDGDFRVPRGLLRPTEKPRVCFTLGTVLPHLGADRVFDIVVSVLGHLAQLDVELVVLIDDKVVSAWPRLPSAVLYAGCLPLSQVLRTCDVTVHHGGQGTALTALAVGSPQLVLPQFDDQLDNAAAVVSSGAGVRLSPEEITPRSVAACCRELLDSAQFGAAAAGVAHEIATQPSTSETVASLEKLVGGLPAQQRVRAQA